MYVCVYVCVCLYVCVNIVHPVAQYSVLMPIVWPDQNFK
jgi:hypothetical protein